MVALLTLLLLLLLLLLLRPQHGVLSVAPGGIVRDAPSLNEM
jgi:hypothetical protein